MIVPIEQRVLAVLDSLGADYARIIIDPDFADTAAFCARYGYALEESGNTIVVATKREPKQFCAAVVQATTRLDVNHTVKRLLGGGRVSFATPEETRDLTGMLIGGVTVFALPPDLPIYVDSAILGLDRVIVGGGSRSLKIACAPDVLLKLPNTTVIEGLAFPTNDERRTTTDDQPLTTDGRLRPSDC